MTTDFTQLNLHPQLVQAVTERGYTAPMPIQSEIIPVMITGRDVIGQAKTGTGKTAAFALPILQNLDPARGRIQALVVVPTRELALQVAEAVADYGRFSKVRVASVYGGQSYGPQIHELQRGVDIVVGTPGRLIDLMDRKILVLSHLRTVVLDEADEMLSMGFIEDIEKILAETPDGRQTALFSATMPREIRSLADRYMHEPLVISIKSEQMTVDTIEQRYYLANQSDKLAVITRLFEIEEMSSVLIFARTRVGTGDLASELTTRGFPAEALNGDLSQDAREYTLNRFRQGKINVLVATDVAARGLDIDDISHVFNYDLPDDPEIYVHRIGRTGRAGKTGIAISLVCPFERRHLRQIEAFTHKQLTKASVPTEEEIKRHREDQLVGQVVMWLKRSRYKREREIVETLVGQGFDPLEIAAASLKLARADEKQRPIDPVREVMESRPVRPSRSRSSQYSRSARSGSPQRGSERVQSWGTTSHEPGMVRLSINLGKEQGIRPTDIVGAIASHTNIPGKSIGKIYIQEHRSMVDVPEELLAQVMGRAGDLTIRRFPVEMQRAN
jgi:ATP-dependent RNA helicase DeaD